MKIKNLVIILFINFFYVSTVNSATWCKAIYPYSSEAFDGHFQKQLSVCKNSDNLFISIHSKYKNSQHLLNASIANFCDLNRQVVISKTEKDPEESYNSAVCVFKRHILREK